MSMEPFLINPARRRTKRRKVSRARRRKRSGGLPGALLSRMIRTYGTKRGMKEAWKAYRTGKRNPESLPASYHRRAAKVHRPVVYSGIRKGVWKASPLHRGLRIVNPFGEGVMIVGANPKRRKGVKKSKRSYRVNEPGRKRRHSYSMKRRNEPGRKYVRHYRRRNAPRSSATAMTVSMRRPMGLLMPVVAGTGGFLAADYIPAAIGMSTSPLTRIGIKAGIALGGGMVVSKFMGSRGGYAFAIGAGINAFNDVVRTYVFKTGVTAGLGAFAPHRRVSGMGAMSPYSTVRSPYAAS